MLTNQSVSSFRRFIHNFYTRFGRHSLPWRLTTDPYSILVSEIMLQQTQVDRVIPKYENFLCHFPDSNSLGSATFPQVLRQWVGLGYNRRAKFLNQAAIQLTQVVHFPSTYEELIKLPGVGDYTAKAVLTFAFNQSHVILETNIRTVFLYHFFPKQQDIHDKDLIPLISQTLDSQNPRMWYWALMDYGSFLKTAIGNFTQKSKHYTKQSKFIGSDRQIRAHILRNVVQRSHSMKQIYQLFPKENPERLHKIINALQTEQMIIAENNRVLIYDRNKDNS